MKSRQILWILIAMGLSGCQIREYPYAELPEIDHGSEYTGLGEAGEAFKYEVGWLDEFQDKQLKGLVVEGLENNPDLRITATRIKIARADLKIAGADLWPEVQFSGTGSRRRVNQIGGGIQVQSTTVSNFNPVFNTRWEVDLWGRIRDTREASLKEWEASGHELEAARLSLAAQLSKTWFDIMEEQAQLALSKKRLQTFEANEHMIQNRFERGLSGALDLRLIRTQTDTTRSTVEQQRATLDALIRQFEVLLGRYPAQALSTRESLPELTKRLPPGIPSGLLNRRPDILASRKRIEAAVSQTDAAYKLRLPQFSLTANGGTSTNELKDVADPDFAIWTLVSNITQPIFQGGAIRGNIDRSRAQLEQLAESYVQTSLQAFLEVETALARENYLHEQRKHLESVVEESTAAEALAWDRYQRGLVDVVTVLESQRRSFDAQSQRLSVANALLQNRIDLYLALGGPVFDSGKEDPELLTVMNQ